MLLHSTINIYSIIFFFYDSLHSFIFKYQNISIPIADLTLAWPKNIFEEERRFLRENKTIENIENCLALKKREPIYHDDHVILYS